MREVSSTVKMETFPILVATNGLKNKNGNFPNLSVDQWSTLMSLLNKPTCNQPTRPFKDHSDTPKSTRNFHTFTILGNSFWPIKTGGAHFWMQPTLQTNPVALTQLGHRLTTQKTGAPLSAQMLLQRPSPTSRFAPPVVHMLLTWPRPSLILL